MCNKFNIAYLGLRKFSFPYFECFLEVYISILKCFPYFLQVVILLKICYRYISSIDSTWVYKSYTSILRRAEIGKTLQLGNDQFKRNE